MKILRLAVLVILLSPGAALAMCGQFTFCNAATDYYVPENLMRLADDARDARETAFLRNLHCRNTSDDKFGRVTCDVGDNEVVWEDERQDFFKAGPVVIMVPANHDQAYNY